MEALTASSANPQPLFPETEAPKPESLFPEPGAEAPAIPHSPEQVNTTAALAALANQRNQESDEALHSTIGRMKDIINNGNEPILRESIARDTQDKQAKALQDQQTQLLNMPYLDGKKLSDLLTEEAAVHAAGIDPHALEKQGVAEIQDLASQDPKQAAVMQREAAMGTLDWSRENMTKLTIFNNAIDQLEQELGKETLGGKVLDMLSLPLQSEYARRRAMPGAGGLLPSTNLANETQRLWRLPMEEFQEELPKVVERIRANSGVLWPNLGLTVSTLQSLRGTAQDAFDANVWGAVDVAGVVPVGKLAKIAKSSAGVLRGVGNRAAAVATTTSGLMKDIGGLAESADTVGNIHTGPELIANSLPGVATTDLVNASPGLAGDVAEKITRMREATNQALSEMNLSTSRMSPEQFAEATKKAEEQLALRLQNDRVLDVRQAKVVNSDDELRAAFARAGQREQDFIDEQHAVNEGEKAVIQGGPGNGTRPDFSKQAEDFAAFHNAAAEPVRLREAIPDDLSSVEGEAIHQSSEKEWGAFTDNLLNFQQKAEAAVLKKKAADFMAWRDAVGRPATQGDITPEGLDPIELQAIHQSSTQDLDEFEAKLTQGVKDKQVDQALAGIPDPISREFNVVDPGIFEHRIAENTGLRVISAYVGDLHGDGGYVDLPSAMEGVSQRGWSLHDVDIVKLDNQYVIRVSQVVPETSVMTPRIDPNKLPRNWQAGVFLKNANDMLHEYFAGPMVKQTHVKAGLKEKVVKPLIRNIATLSRSSRKALAAVVDVGQREANAASPNGFGKWYNVNEFNYQFERIKGRPATEKEVMAYYSYKELNDIDFAIRNDATFVDKARRGVQTVSVKNPNIGLDIPRTNGRVIENPDLHNLRFFDAEEGKMYSEGKEPVDVHIKYSTGNYRLIELEADYTGFGKDPMKYVLAHNDGSTVGPLARNQIDYVPGGHRMYDGEWYVKQAVKHTFTDGDKRYLQPMTHSNHRTYTRAADFAEKQEDARVLYNAIKTNGGKLTDEDRAVFARSSAGTFEKFHQLVEQGAIQPDTKFEALFDKGLPSEMVGNPLAMRWAEDEVPEYEKELISRGRMYYSPKGEHLRDETEQLAHTVDPFKVLDRSLRNAIQTKAFADYNTKVVEEWYRMAFPYIDMEALGANRSAQNAFVHGRLKTGMRGSPEGAALYQSLEQMRTIHKRLLNYKTSDMAQQDMAGRRFANFMEGKSDYLAGKGYDWADASPLQAFRGWVFDSYIGFWNPVRLWLHATTAVAAQTMHPVYGFRAGMMAPVMKMLEMNQHSSVLDTVARWSELHGFEQGEYKEMVNQWRKSSWGSVSGDYGMIDHYPMLQAAEGFRDKGRFLFRMAEKYNRMVGWQIAWQKTRDEFPELARDSEEFLNKVHLATDDLTNNQTAASRAQWQTGLLSAPTQFHQFSARLLERMLPAKLGGNSRISAGAKMRLVAGQAIMYGAAGIPGAGAIMSYAAEQYQQATGQPLDDATWRTMSKGMWDSLIFGLSGGKLDTALAERAGTGHDWEKFIGDIASGRGSSVLQFAAGPSGEMAGSILDTTQKLALYYRSQQLDQLTPEDAGMIAMDLGKSIQTLSVAQKEYWMLKTGHMVNQKDGGAMFPVNTLDELAVAIGIPLRMERQRGDMLQDKVEREQMVHGLAQQMTLFDRNYYRAVMDHDEHGMKYWSNMSTGLLQPFHDDPYMTTQVMEESFRLTKQNGPEYQSLLMSIEKQTGLVPAGENH